MSKPKKPQPPTHIKRLQYDAHTETLEIEFQRGGIYQFFSVPEEVYLAFEASDAKWAYYLSHIRKGYRSRPKH